MFGLFKARRAARLAAEEHAADLAAYDARMVAWQIRHEAAVENLANAEQYAGTTDVDDLILQPGEHAFLCADGAGLVESRTTPGEWVGRSSGVSVPLLSVGGHPVRYHVGQSHGEYLPGTPVPKIVDTGALWITDARIVYQGEEKTRDVDLDKVAAVAFEPVFGLIRLSVTGRDRAIVLAVGPEGVGVVQARLDLALAHHHGTLPDLVARLREDFAHVAAERPALPPDPRSGADGGDQPDAEEPVALNA